MYHCNEKGRNRHIWFETGMEMAVQARNQIETGIRAGMPRGEFIPYFEPQVDIATGRLMGFEMLMRWDSPEHGMIPPERFIPRSEEHTSELQSLMRISYAVFCLKKKKDKS